MPVGTAGGIAWVDEMADMVIGPHVLKDGYVNRHMPTTLISEGVLGKQGWTFVTTEYKLCYTAVGEAFQAAKQGPLHFWPIEGGTLDTQPHINHPMTAEASALMTRLGTAATAMSMQSQDLQSGDPKEDFLSTALKSGANAFGSDADHKLGYSADRPQMGHLGEKVATGATDTDNNRLDGGPARTTDSYVPQYVETETPEVTTATGLKSRDLSSDDPKKALSSAALKSGAKDFASDTDQKLQFSADGPQTTIR